MQPEYAMYWEGCSSQVILFSLGASPVLGGGRFLENKQAADMRLTFLSCLSRMR